LSIENGPKGWLSCLIDTLSDNAVSWALLILDEFVNNVSDCANSTLLETIKMLVWNTRIHVIFMIPSEPYTNFYWVWTTYKGLFCFLEHTPYETTPRANGKVCNGQYQGCKLWL